MKKKLAILLLFAAVIFVMAACEREYTPDPAVKEYLNNGMSAINAYDHIAKASFVETRSVKNKAGEVHGSYRSEISMDKSDPNNLGLEIHTVFSGECIQDDRVVEMTSTLVKINGEYRYTVSKLYEGGTKPVVTVEVMEAEDAENLLVAIVYTDNGSYSEGLYYGDLFMLQIFRFPSESFHIDEEADLCVFDEGMLIKEYYDLEDVELHQVTKINRLGLLEYNSERYVGTKSDYVMESETVPTYEYVQSED